MKLPKKYFSRKDRMSGTVEIAAEALITLLNPELHKESDKLKDLIKEFDLRPRQVLSIKVTNRYFSIYRQNEMFACIYLSDDRYQGMISVVSADEYDKQWKQKELTEKGD